MQIKKNKNFKTFSIFFCIIFFLLGFWQVSRFISKKNKFFQINEVQKELFASRHQIFNKNSQKEFKENNDLLFFKKIVVCGVFEPEKSFIFYNSGKGKGENLYKIIIPIENFDLNEKFLFVYESFDQKKSIIEKISQVKEKKFKYSCFSGILTKIPDLTKENFLQKISNFNGFQKNQNIVNSIEQDSKIKIINHEITKKNLAAMNLDLEKINFLIDPNGSDFNFVSKNYKHHFFYMIMWFGLGIYMIYFLIKNKKNFA